MAKLDNKNIWFIILAAGLGSRLGEAVPKQYLTINGKNLIEHVVDKLKTSKLPLKLALVLHQDFINDAAFAHPNVDIRVVGGKTRQDSVRLALEKIPAQDDDIILIHDVARIFIDESEISQIINAVINFGGAATLALKATDTVKFVDQEIMRTLPRENIYLAATPQGFTYGLIKTMHNKFQNLQFFTDDIGLCETQDVKISIIPTSKLNFKITTQDDLTLAKALLQA